MPRFTQRSIDELRTRLNIVEVVERHVRLKKSGRNYKGLSPFNNEKTPSFYVEPAKGVYYCFSSNKGGDAIRFIMEVENLSFFEAVEALAQRFNINLEYEEGGGPSREDRTLRRELLDIHEQATAWFHEQFMAAEPLAAEVRDYWTGKRRFSLDVARDFKIGFAPPREETLMRLLTKKGHSVDALRQCGLYFAREGDNDPRRFLPRFRGRLMIPIREPTQGQVIAFTARVLPCTPEDDKTRDAKYVNSPETPLFKKSRMVFNLDRAQKSARQGDHGFLMVEGQLDAIRCYTSGFTNTIAPQGTSVTDEQLHLLRRHSERLKVVLDGDAAGQRAALRVLPMALEAGLEPSFVVLPPGQDPDSLLADGGPAALQELVDHGAAPIAFACRALLPQPGTATPRERAEAMRQIFDIIQKTPGEVVRVEYLREAAARLQVDFDAARRDFSRVLMGARKTNAAPKEQENPVKPEERLTLLEADLFCLILQHEDLGGRVSELVEDKWVDEHTVEGRLLGRLLWELRDGSCDSVNAFVSNLDDDTERQVACALSVRANTMEVDDPQRHAKLLLERLFARFRNRRIEELDRLMANPPEPNADIHPLLKERMELLRTVKHPPQFAF